MVKGLYRPLSFYWKLLPNICVVLLLSVDLVAEPIRLQNAFITGIDPPSLTILVRSPLSQTETYRVYLPGPLDLSKHQSVEISGEAFVDIDGKSAIQANAIKVYSGLDGRVIMFPLPDTSFPTKDATPESGASTLHSGSINDYSITSAENHLGDARSKPDIELLRPVKNLTVTSVILDRAYIQEDSSSAIRVNGITGVRVGDQLTINGVLSSEDNCERVLLNSAYTITGRNSNLKPLRTTSRNLGGESLNVYNPGATDAGGLYNVGMLSKLIGVVESVDPSLESFVLDDGQQSVRVRLKVDAAESQCQPPARTIDISSLISVGDLIAVTGNIGLEKVAGNCVAILTPSTATDIENLSRLAKPSVQDSGQYQAVQSPIIATWTSTDWPHVAEYSFAVSDTPIPENSPDALTWSNWDSPQSGLSYGGPLASGKTYYFYVRTRDNQSRQSPIGRSDGIIIDGQAPRIPEVSAFPHSSTTSLNITYENVSDDLSGLALVELWVRQEGSSWQYTGQSLAVSSGQFSYTAPTTGKYYIALVAEDNVGNRTASPSGIGQAEVIIDSSFNYSGRVVHHTAYAYPGGPAVRQSTYDITGKLESAVLSQLGAEGELLAVKGSAPSMSYQYDAKYQVTGQTDGRGYKTEYQYDSVGNLTRIVYPGSDPQSSSGNMTYEGYTPYGQPSRVIDGNGVEINYRYNKNGQVTEVDYDTLQSNLDQKLTYDPYGRLSRVDVGPLSGASQTVRDWYQYLYDDQDNTTSSTVKYFDLPASIALSNTYYPDGSLQALTTPSGSFTYIYDYFGRPVQLTNPLGDVFHWDYFDNGQVKTQRGSTQTQNIYVTEFTYNQRALLSTLVNKGPPPTSTIYSSYGQPTGLSYDARGNLKRVTATYPLSSLFAQQQTVEYTYDFRNHLTSENLTPSNHPLAFESSYNFDATDNLVLNADDPQKFNHLNQKTAVGDFQYDGNGSPTTYDGVTAVFDAEDRLSHFGLLSSAYTWTGTRAWKQDGTGPKRFYIYAGKIPVIELDAAGAVTAVNTYGPYGTLARNENGFSDFYLFDPLGNVVQVVDSTSQAVSQEAYFNAYGLPLGEEQAGSSPYAYKGLAGYYRDSETGLYLLTHRYYDAAQARFITRDPIGYAGGYNLYAYANGNPVNALDPLGWCAGGYSSTDLTLDVVGMTPGIVGVVADGLNAYRCYQRGDYTGAVINGISLIPFLGDGFALVAKPVRMALRVQKDIQIAADVVELEKDADRVWTAVEKMRYGTQKHNEWYPTMQSQGYVTNQAIIPGSKLRPDAVNFETKHIVEYKPRSNSSTDKGLKQVEKYRKLMEKHFGEGWTADVDYYISPWNP